MIIELGDNGLRSRYHWTSYDIDDSAIQSYLSTLPIEIEIKGEILPGDTVERAADGLRSSSVAAYLAMRLTHPFLTDDNHDWIARDYGPCKPEHQALKDLTQSSRYSIVIQHKPGQEWYGYRYWFHLAYRVPGQPY